MNIGELCAREIVWVEPDDSAVAVARRMREEHVGCIVVAERGEKGVHTAGIITDRDLAMLLVARDVDPELILARDIMTAPVITCRAEHELAETVELMHRHSVRRLPVLDRDNNLIGLISHEDIFRQLALQLARVSVVGEDAIEREGKRLPASA